jgi:hypothetical protein
MKTIYKYPVKVVGEQEMFLPVGFRVLKIDVQDNNLFLWALVRPLGYPSVQGTEKLKIRMYGTGHDIKNDEGYLDTVLLNGFVWHIFTD